LITDININIFFFLFIDLLTLITIITFFLNRWLCIFLHKILIICLMFYYLLLDCSISWLNIFYISKSRQWR
jgi:hypothetical protein